MRAAHRRGMILAGATMALIVLTGIALSYGALTRIEMRHAVSRRHAAAAYWVARGAAERMVRATTGFRLDPLGAEETDPFQALGRWVWLQVPGGRARVRVLDLGTRVGLYPYNERRMSRILEEGFAVDPDRAERLAAALADWCDVDSLVRPGGAEGDYYRRLDPPYLPADREPARIEELARVRGFDLTLIYGDPTVHPPLPGMIDVFTAIGGAEEIGADPLSAPPVVLRRFFGLSAEETEVWLAVRAEPERLDPLSDFADLLGPTRMQEVRPLILSPNSRAFEIAVEGWPDGASRPGPRIRWWVRRSPVEPHPLEIVEWEEGAGA